MSYQPPPPNPPGRETGNPYQSPHAPPAQSPYLPSTPRRTSTMAVLSLVMSCLVLMLGPLGSIPGIVLGHLALGEIRRDGSVEGRGLAIAGLVIGYVGLLLFIAYIGFVVWFMTQVFPTMMQNLQKMPQPVPPMPPQPANPLDPDMLLRCLLH
jgi:hypothetical protein